MTCWPCDIGCNNFSNVLVSSPSSMSGEYIYSGGFWDSKACAVCARWDRSGAAAPNSAPKIVWQFLEPSLVLLQQSTDQSEKSCEDNLPVSSNISKPNSAPKRCDRIGSASVATWGASKEGNSKGGENDGRLLIGFYYSAVTGNRKQVLTGSSESCEHKCRWNTLSFKLQVLFES